jgi:fructan beta-fructosidase
MKNHLTFRSIYLLLPFLFSMCHNQKDILISDFNSNNYAPWKSEGKAFGTGPSSGSFPVNIAAQHFASERLASSYISGDSCTGKLISQEFSIERDFINFQIGGSKIPDKTCVNLIIDGKVVASATGANDNVVQTSLLNWISWDVSKWKGRKASVEIIDMVTEKRDAYISVDNIWQSNKNLEQQNYSFNQERSLTINNKLINIPVKRGAYPQIMSISVDGKLVREFVVELAESEPDYWMFLDAKEWQGKNVIFRINKMAKESNGLKSIYCDSTFRGSEDIYNEASRAQYHFSSKRGWINDPNGLVFYQGEYHMFYQHNPLGWPWGNMTWGHAISIDLVHWTEMDYALYPDSLGTIFSGSAVVDWNNTSGLQKGDEKTLVAFYTAAGGTSVWSRNNRFSQCMAYSNDKGRTWVKYEHNPVLPHVIGENRDPKVAWCESARIWVMAIYLDKTEYALFTSRNLREWHEIQRINVENTSECPDFFRIALDGDSHKEMWVLTGANGHFIAGTFNGRKFMPETKVYPSEWGKNYYAIQSYSDIKDGRRIQIGWMAGAELTGMAFNQQMSFPRELSLKTTKDGIRLFAIPAREIAALHKEKKSWNKTEVKANNDFLSSLKSDRYHIISTFQVQKNGNAEFGFNLRGFEILYNSKTGTIKATRPSDKAVSEVKVPPVDGNLKIELLLDRTSVEIFINDGEIPMAFFYLPDEANRRISLIAKGENVVLKSMDVYELESAWGKKPLK